MRRGIAIAIGLVLSFLAATTSLTNPGSMLARPPEREELGSESSGRGGDLVLLEDGSWVPRSYFDGVRSGDSDRSADPIESARASEAERVPGSFIVDIAPGLDPHEVAPQIAADYGGEVAFVYDEVIGGFAFKGDDSVRERMSNDPRIRSVDPDYEAHLVGHTLPAEKVAIKAPEAWGVSQGTGAVVAILDSGVNSANPHIAANLLGRDGSCVGSNGSEGSGHGTAVAGHVFGHYGALPDAKGYMVKVFPNNSTSTSYTNIICGLNLVKSWVATRGIQAANLSLSGSATSGPLQTAVRQLRDSGVVVVAAAGNSGGNAEYPAAYPEAVAVSALGQTNTTLASFSSRGAAIDIGAPGSGLTTLTVNGCCSTGSGTSFAAPQVAAAAALVKALNPATSPDDVVALLQKTGFCPPGATPGTNYDGGNCSGAIRSGDSDGFAEPALNLEGSAKGVDLLPAATFVAPVTDQIVRDGELSTIRVSATDDDTTSAELDVDIKVGAAGTFQQATFNAGAACPVTGTCHELSWAGGIPDGPLTISAQVTEAGNGSKTVSVDVSVDNVDDPPVVTWQAPESDDLVGSPVLLRVSATDDRGLAGVKVFEGATELATLSPNGAFYEATLTLPEAPHTLRAEATDGGGHVATADRTFTVTSILYQYTFPSGGWTEGWTESPSGSHWHKTSSCGSTSGPYAYYGMDSYCQFRTSSAGYLISPLRTGLPTGEKLLLTFDSKERVESCSGCTRDRRYVQVNYGNGWQTLSYRHAGSNRGSGVWEPRQFDLDVCTGRVQVRFYFQPTSFLNNNFYGWGIDNFTLRRTGQPATC